MRVKRAEAILFYEDFVGYMLTGQRKVSYSSAARSMAFDIRKMEWSKELLKLAGIRAEQMSRAGEAVYRNWRHITGDGKGTASESRYDAGGRRTRSELCGPGKRIKPHRGWGMRNGDMSSLFTMLPEP